MKFEKNVGKMERLARFGLALVLGGLYAMGMIEGTAGVIALIVAIVMLATSLLSFARFIPSSAKALAAPDAAAIANPKTRLKKRTKKRRVRPDQIRSNQDKYPAHGKIPVRPEAGSVPVRLCCFAATA